MRTYCKERVERLLRLPKTDEVVTELIKLNTGLLFNQLKKFKLYNDPEAISRGYEALYKAIITYDDGNTASFGTYASVCMFNAIGSYARSLTTKLIMNTVYYNGMMDSEHEYFAILPANESVENTVIDREHYSNVSDVIRYCYSNIKNANHKRVIKLWLDSECNMSQQALGDTVGYSQATVRRIIEKFRKQIKVKLEANK